VKPDGSDLQTMKAVQIARRWRQSLVLSNEHHDGLRELLRGLPETMRWNELRIARKKRLLAREDWPLIAILAKAAVSRWGIDFRTAMEEGGRLQAQGVAPTPLVTGDDLTAAGYRPGPLFKTALDSVYDAQLEGRVTEKDAAMAMAGRILRGEE
jgi:poly(A) polymerase